MLLGFITLLRYVRPGDWVVGWWWWFWHAIADFSIQQFFNYEDANPGQDSAGADEEFNIKPAESDLENGRRME